MLKFKTTMTNFIENLLTRRSVAANDLCEPGPSDEQLQQILAVAHRVPDHGKIGPWRFVVFKGDARQDFSNKLGEIFARENPEASDKLTQFESERIIRAPLVIAVIASPVVDHPKVPQWEQLLSVGAACQNILVAALALGFGAQWLTEWYSYNEKVNVLLKLKPHEKIAGFIYIGSYREKPSERPRPALEERLSYWNG